MAILENMSAREIADAVSSGEFSAVEVAEASLARAEVLEPSIGAFIELSPELALNAARAVDAARTRGDKLGPLAGVPVAFKDNMQLIGTHTTCASHMLEGYNSPYTATCVSRMLDAGALPIGKTNMDEFAFGSSTETSYFHRTANPWDTDRVPGGSSGGSAAAVAAAEVSITLGSDTGGSIRQPAAFCGVVGFKPSYGVVSRYGVVAFGSSLDQVGPLARSVEDVALAMDALTSAGKDAYDSTNLAISTPFVSTLEKGPSSLRIAICPELMETKGMSAEMKQALSCAQEALASAGASFVEVELEHISASIAAYYVIGPAEAFSNLARFDGIRYGYQEPNCSSLAEQSALSRAHGFGEEAKRRQMLGAHLLASGVYDKYYYPAQQVRTLITEDYRKVFEQADALLLPTSPSVAWRFGEVSDPTAMYAADMFTISNNIAGNAGVSVPVGLGQDSGLPVAAQLQGPSFKDAELLCIAQLLENEVGRLPLAKGVSA